MNYRYILILTINLILLTRTVNMFGEENNHYLYDLNHNYLSIKEDGLGITYQKYKTNSNFQCISEVPLDNAVATDNYAKKFTLMSFKENSSISCLSNIIKKFINFIPQIFSNQATIKSKDETAELVFQNLDINVGQDNAKYHLPIINQNTIGYASERDFYLINLRNNTIKYFAWIAKGFEETIHKVSIADAKKMHFIFYIKRFLGSHRNFNYYIRLIDCSGKKAVVLKEIQTYVDGNKDTFIEYEVIKNKIALFEGTIKRTDPRRKISILDSGFNESSYPPFENFFLNYKEKLFIDFYTEHPALPFSIIGGEESDKILILDESLKFFPFIKLYDNLAYHYFSPSGRWLISQTSQYPHRSKFFIFPISERYPFYLGSPIFSGLRSNGLIDPNNAAWTTNPESFVFADLPAPSLDFFASGDELFRIVLKNGEKLHDTIVNLDLKKNEKFFNKQRNFLLQYDLSN